ncbi:GNAT family N-acetyltransferase [Virgibacillus sp. W0181]|uniref:GNAT family N-acetyltransferase n=1 Tax=Virgibacillus sp. W0181 TaxID=3391581 RepID=UPI003F449BD2
MGEIKQLDRSDYEEIFALQQFAFQYELSEEALEKKQAETDRHTIWGWIVDGKLAGKLHLIPLTAYINGVEYAMGGVASVATWPEYRRQGIAKHLLSKALQHMKENGQVVSYLHPFSVAFYRRYGWEIAFAQKQYTIPIASLKRKWEGSGYIRSMDSKSNIDVLHSIYSTYAKEFNGMVVRDEKWWEQRVLKNDSDHTAVAYNLEGVPQGYIIFQVKNDVFTVKEMAYTCLNGWKLMYEFIANHDSMAAEVNITVPEDDKLPLLVDEPTFTQEVTPYFMVRIVDVLPFLKQYQFNNLQQQLDTVVNLHVEDRFLPENSGTYQLQWEQNETRVDYARGQTDGPGINCNIEVLSAMLMNYKRPTEFFEAGLLDGDFGQAELLEKLIPDRQTYFTDFF